MEVVCPQCKSKFRIASEKLTAAQKVSIRCPKCRGPIRLGSGASEPVAQEAPEAGGSGADIYDASDRPFDYLEEGVETALVCEHDLEIKNALCQHLEGLGYHVVEAASARNALKYMRYHVYDLIAINEAFEATGSASNHVLQYLNQLPMSIRRNIFVVLLGRQFRTMDNMLAFNRSVNLTLNVKDVGDLDKILKAALKEHAGFYHIFRESLLSVGRA
ncbi:MAG: zinc-ribbon domain-containing protein [Deltaproteobacteria bacterium]|nr:zinc-ribbon domain-containing protein [Deltaproteobacteria bacterium]